MDPIVKLADSKFLFWVLLAAPAAWFSSRYLTGATTYGEFIHETGLLSAQLLIATLAITPLRMAFKNAGWTMWLMRRRRALGVAVFGYAALHLAAYLVRKSQLSLILDEGAQPDLLTGWVAMVIFAALTVTSNDASVRMLKRNWKRLHQWAYLGAVLTFAHWVLTAFDPMAGYAHAAALAVLFLLRAGLVLHRKQRRAPSH